MGETKRIYILLIRSNSMLSRIIHFITRAGYTHASLGFSEDCQQLYSFARRYIHLPFPVCFMNENIHRGFLGKNPKVPCALYYTDIPEEIYEKLHERVLRMLDEKKEYGYNYLGLLSCLFGIAWERHKKYFCSEFVAKTLKETNALPIEKAPSLVRPVDFQKISQLHLVYEGTISGLRNQIVSSV